MRIKSKWVAFFVLLVGCLLISRLGHALDVGPWLSSNTATADSTGTLCGQFVYAGSTYTQQGIIHAIVISSGATAGSNVQLYDSSWTVISATSPLTIGPINTNSVVAPLVYDVTYRNGLCYTKAGTATVQILYRCF